MINRIKLIKEELIKKVFKKNVRELVTRERNVNYEREREKKKSLSRFHWVKTQSVEPCNLRWD